MNYCPYFVTVGLLYLRQQIKNIANSSDFKEENIMKKVITIILVAAIAVTSAFTLTACGSAKKTAQPTTAPTTAATQPATQASQASASQMSVSGTGSSDSDNSSSGYNDDSSAEYAGITYDKACSLALEQSGDGAQVISCTQGTIAGGPQYGDPAWVVVVQLADGTQSSYYCGYPFCYNIEDKAYDSSQDDAGQTYAGITEDKAYSLAQERAGDGAEITSCTQGTIPSGTQAGDEAWVLNVTMADGTTKTYYAGYPFIYDADSLS